MPCFGKFKIFNTGTFLGGFSDGSIHWRRGCYRYGFAIQHVWWLHRVGLDYPERCEQDSLVPNAAAGELDRVSVSFHKSPPFFYS